MSCHVLAADPPWGATVNGGTAASCYASGGWYGGTAVRQGKAPAVADDAAVAARSGRHTHTFRRIPPIVSLNCKSLPAVLRGLLMRGQQTAPRSVFARTDKRPSAHPCTCLTQLTTAVVHVATPSARPLQQRTCPYSYPHARRPLRPLRLHRRPGGHTRTAGQRGPAVRRLVLPGVQQLDRHGVLGGGRLAGRHLRRHVTAGGWCGHVPRHVPGGRCSTWQVSRHVPLAGRRCDTCRCTCQVVWYGMSGCFKVFHLLSSVWHT